MHLNYDTFTCMEKIEKKYKYEMLHLFSFKTPILNIFLNNPRISITCKK